MPGTNEAFSRVKIDAQLRDQGWDVLNPNAVRFEYVLPDRTKADYVLCDRHRRAEKVFRAKLGLLHRLQRDPESTAEVQTLLGVIARARGAVATGRFEDSRVAARAVERPATCEMGPPG